MTGTGGVILAVLAFLVGLVWLVFPFIAMNKLRGIRDEVEKGNRYLADIVNRKPRSAPTYPRPTVRVASYAHPVPTARVIPAGEVVPPPRVVPLKISKGGQVLGLKDTTSIKVMLERGELSLEDQYFDAETNEWVTLDCHPEFS